MKTLPLLSAFASMLLLTVAVPLSAPADEPVQSALKFTSATYAGAIRGADGHVDVKAMAARLKELGVSTYYWLVNVPGDWESLQEFLPEAAAMGLQVWPYLVPPSESPPHVKYYSEPYKLDYQRWAEEIARLSLQFPNVTAWVIDDFYANRDLYTPEYVKGMQARAHAVNPKLAFLPLMYFSEIDRTFVENYRGAIDGVVVAYPQDRGEINQAWAMLNDVVKSESGDIRFPAVTHSTAGDFGMASQTARVLPRDSYVVHFREMDDFNGKTTGYHFKQLLVDGAVVWESDVAVGGRGWQEVTADVTAQVKGKKNVSVAFRLLDRQGVGNFPVRWRMADLKCEGLEPAAGLELPEKWTEAHQGAFEAGFDGAIRPGEHRFHIPFVVMTAAQDVEFRLRHDDPVNPERIAGWLRMCLEAQRDGKCDAVVTYALDLRASNPNFDPIRDLFREMGQGRPRVP
jgi:hypothetical protein